MRDGDVTAGAWTYGDHRHRCEIMLPNGRVFYASVSAAGRKWWCHIRPIQRDAPSYELQLFIGGTATGADDAKRRVDGISRALAAALAPDADAGEAPETQ